MLGIWCWTSGDDFSKLKWQRKFGDVGVGVEFAQFAQLLVFVVLAKCGTLFPGVR